MSAKLSNDKLTVEIAEMGAELVSMKSRSDNTEYIWQADPAYWGKHAPILFPIVGKVKNDTYRIGEASYKMSKHGFARESGFELLENTQEKASFRLSWNEQSLKVYPYRFELDVIYDLIGSTLKLTYKVRNVDKEDIYFSIGGHPAFNCPIAGTGISFDDYNLEFDTEETAGLIRVNIDGTLKSEPVPFLEYSKRIPLSHELFKDDALVFRNLKSNKIELKSDKDSHKIVFDFTGFPYLGLWTKADGAPYVCIEPWFGHADFEGFDGDFREKDGILKLGKDEEFSCSYSISAL